MLNTMRMKQSSHRNGPRVAPWPGPKSIERMSFMYPSLDIPYSVLIR
jgi:hypothetical protein